MSKRDDRLYLGHMLDLARRVEAKVAGLTREEFDRDENLRLALTHLLQTIGEAARHTSESLRAAHPDVPWRAIIGMRHKVVHDYFTVDEDVVWTTATQRIAPLVEQLSAILQP